MIDLVHNVALLVALSVVSGALERRWDGRRRGKALQGLLFGSAAVVIMLAPLHFESGIQFDARSVAISVGGLYFGPIAAIIAGVMAALCRIAVGGDGVLTGLLVIGASAGIGVACHRLWRGSTAEITVGKAWSMGLAVHVVMLLLMFTLPGGAAWFVLPKIGPPVIVLFPLATVLIAMILTDQRIRRGFLRQLRDAQERFERAVEHIPDVVVIYDRDLRIRYINAATRRLTGRPEEDYIGRRDDEVWPPEVYEAYLPALRRAAETGELVKVEAAVDIPGAGRRHLSIDCVPILDDGGAVLEVLGITRDLTEQREAAMALEESEASLRLFLDFAPAAIAMFDREMRYLHASERWRTDYQLGNVELLGRSHYEVFPEIGEDWKALHRRCLAGETLSREEDPFPRADGQLDWVRWAILPWRNAGGAIGGIVMFTEVITERKRAQQALADREALLRMAGELARFGGWSVDLPELRFTWSNEVREIHELPPGATPTLEEAFSYFHPNCRDAITDAFRACAREGTPYDLELQLVTAQGRTIWVRTMGQATRNESGSIVRVQGAFQDISQFKELELTASRSEFYLRQLADAMPLIVWTSDPDGNIDYASRKLSEYSGNFVEGAPGHHWGRLVHPDDLERSAATWSAALEGQTPFFNEVRLRRSDGTYRWHHVEASPTMDDSGAVVKWLGAATDIHDTKLNEEAMTAMAERLTTTLESITDAFYTLDREWRFTYMNPEAERLLRHPKEDLMGKVAGQQFQEALGSDIEKNFARALRDNRTVDFETYYAPFDCWFEAHVYPSEEGIAVYFRDITERVKADSALREVTRRLKNILDFSPLLITEIDLDGRYQLANNSACAVACAVAGVAPGDLQGRMLRDVLPAEIAELFLSRIAKVAEHRGPLAVEDTLQIDGNERSFSTVLFPVVDGGGTVTSVGGIAEDVSDHRHAEMERERLASQLRQAQKMEAIGRLAGGVAHDFNNMLSVILGYVDMAILNAAQDPILRADLEQVQEAAERSAELTRQLLAFARKQAIAPKVLDLNETLAGFLKMLARLIGEDIDLLWRPGRGVGPVCVDPTQIDQILANLAVNARDAIGGNGKLTIETANAEIDADFCEHNPGAAPGRYVLLAVSDDGCGMDAATRAQIFEPFFTTKAQGLGTGLGLATVYGIVKQNGGFINVYSELGLGSTFKVYFPCHEALAAPGGGSAARPQSFKGTETILLVEDEAALLNLVKRLLEHQGYTVLPAGSPNEALEIATGYAGTIHMLMTDVVMPDMNGRDLWVQLDALRPGIKTLFMSGYTADVIAHHGILDKGVNFLQKPFKIDGMAAKVREVLDGGETT